MNREVKTAGWIALSGLIWVTMEYMLGLHSSRIELHAKITLFAILPVILIYVLHYRGIKNSRPNEFTFHRGFFSGLYVTGVATPLSMVGFLIFYYLINPNLFSDFKRYSVENKIMTTEQASDYFSLSNYITQIAVGTLVMGLLLSAILSFIFKSKTK